MLRLACPRCLVEAALDPSALLADDLVELAPDVTEHVVKPVPLEHRLPPALEPVDQVVEPGHVPAGRVAGPPASVHQSPERCAEVALGHDVVRERVEDLLRLEVRDLLTAVPGRIPGTGREGITRGAGATIATSTDSRRSGRDLRSQVCWLRGIGGHRW